MVARLAVAALLFCSLAIGADTIAVLPFFNLNQSTSVDLDWIGESAAETIHGALSSYGLISLSRDDRMEIFSRLGVRPTAVLTRATVMKIGQSLDASHVVFGDFAVESGNGGATDARSAVRLVLHVIDLHGLKESPTFEETGALRNLSLLESALAWKVLQYVAPDSPVSEEAFLRERPEIKVEAMESYIRGLMSASVDQRTRLFTQAVKLDDRFSPPNFELGRMAFTRRDYKAAAPWLLRVTRADPHYLEASFDLGICRYYDGDFDAALRLFKMIAVEMPLNEVLNNLAAALSRRNDASAAEAFRKALEGDEGDPDYWFNYGYGLWKLGQYAKAADQFRAALQRSPEDQEATLFLGRALQSDPYRPGDPKIDGRERIKTLFEDSAYRQLQAELRKK